MPRSEGRVTLNSRQNRLSASLTLPSSLASASDRYSSVISDCLTYATRSSAPSASEGLVPRTILFFFFAASAIKFPRSGYAADPSSSLNPNEQQNSACSGICAGGISGGGEGGSSCTGSGGGGFRSRTQLMFAGAGPPSPGIESSASKFIAATVALAVTPPGSAVS